MAVVIPDYLWHLTINTGDTRRSYRSEVANETLAAMRQAGMDSKDEFEIRAGGHFKCEIRNREGSGAQFMIRHTGEPDIPLIGASLAITDDEELDHWAVLEKIYQEKSLPFPLPPKPESTPWLAVFLQPCLSDTEKGGELIGILGDFMGWVADFERCLAWLFIEDYYRANFTVKHAGRPTPTAPGQGKKHAFAKYKVCCICKVGFIGYGNNPSPVKEEGRCCDECNWRVVIPARLGYNPS
jgi:hypothetical protein